MEEYKLLANPYHLKKEKPKDETLDLDESIISLLNKRFPGNVNDVKDHSLILNKIDLILKEITISNIIEDTINGVINTVLDEPLLHDDY